MELTPDIKKILPSLNVVISFWRQPYKRKLILKNQMSHKILDSAINIVMFNI